MQIFNVILKSKNRKSLENFYQFFNRNTFQNFKSIKIFFQKKSKKKVITLLKSPHVNKSAQEQFELKIFSMQYKIKTSRAILFMVFLKKMKTNLFPDVSIKLQKISNVLKQKTYNKKLFYTERYKKKKFQIIKTKNSNLFKNEEYKKDWILEKKIKNKMILKLLDTYGK
jgi:ribosomal protein S10